VSTEDDSSHKRRPHIITSLLSQSVLDLIWVATSDGRIWLINWKTGAGSGPDECFHVESTNLVDVALASIQLGEEQQDVVFTSEKLGKHSRQLIAYDLESLKQGKGATLYTDKRGALMIKSASNGNIITCATRDGILIGSLQHPERPVDSLNDLTYAFYSFELEDRITCLDVRISQGSKKRRKISVVDLAVGGARGKILVYQDVLMGLRSKGGQSPGQAQQTLQHRIYHWHRRAVHTLKWTSDGEHDPRTEVTTPY
jgi:NET1-associated nuclear protein 1 (U3 small nucleolar RNA-associated protein 17)